MAKIYIAGPMRGYKDLNFPAFYRAEKELKSGMWDVVNPAELNPDPETPWVDCMRVDIKALADCDAIYLLRGWENSDGANIEYYIARALKLQIIFQTNNNFVNNDQ